MLTTWIGKLGRALKPFAVNNNINLVTNNNYGIGLALNNWSCDAFWPYRCLTCLKIVVQWCCHPGCYLLLECPILFIILVSRRFEHLVAPVESNQYQNASGVFQKMPKVRYLNVGAPVEMNLNMPDVPSLEG